MPSAAGPIPDAARRLLHSPVVFPAVLLLVAGLLTYWNSLQAPFLFDDQYSIVNNAEIRNWRHLTGFLHAPVDTPVASRPLVDFSFAINFAAGGLNVTGYHAINIAIHLLCGLLVFGVIRRALALPRVGSKMRRLSMDVAFATAMIWVVHPLNSEVVDYTTQRTESMMALFYLLTLYASIRAIDGQRPRVWQALAVGACALGMTCKETMVTAPVVVLLFDATVGFRSVKDAVPTRWPLYAGLGATWSVLAALMWWGPRVRSAWLESGVSSWTYLLNQAVMIVRYLRLAVWPRDLVLNYGPSAPLTLGEVLPAASFIVILLIVTAALLIRRGAIAFAAVWFFATLAPTSSVIPIATEVGAERRMYLPLVALILLGVVAVWRGWNAVAPKVRAFQASSIMNRVAVERLVLFALCAALAMMTADRNREYASPLEIAQTNLDRWPSAAAHAMVGAELAALRSDKEAIEHLRQAVDTYPRARYNLAVELFNVGQVDEGLIQLQMFADRYPWPPEVVHARTALGKMYMSQQNWLQAAEEYRRVLAVAPGELEARRALGDSLMRIQAWREAVVEYRIYLEVRPNDAAAWTGLGVALSNVEQVEEAITALSRAVKLAPRDADARYLLATCLLRRGDTAAAREEVHLALQLRPRWPAAMELMRRIVQ